MAIYAFENPPSIPSFLETQIIYISSRRPWQFLLETSVANLQLKVHLDVGCTQREPPTMGKQLVNFITCRCESSAPFLSTIFTRVVPLFSPD